MSVVSRVINQPLQAIYVKTISLLLSVIVRWPRYKSGQNCANYIYKQTFIFMLQHVKFRKILDIDTFPFLYNKRKICSNQRRLFSVDLGYHWAINCSDYEVNTSVV